MITSSPVGHFWNRVNVTQRRSFALRQRIADLTTSKLERLSRGITKGILALGREEHTITESRRPYEKRSVMRESLAERLELQRTKRQGLVPAMFKVSRCRRYLVVEWTPVSCPAPNDGIDMPLHSLSSSTGAIASEATRSFTPRPTRLLAEFLRAQSCSTDVVGSGVLIYGKRGTTILEVVPHGNYAVRLQFSDDHSGGIFPYDYLHHLGGEHKFSLMREYIKALREKKKSRLPPTRRQRSTLRPASSSSGAAAASTGGGCGSKKKNA